MAPELEALLEGRRTRPITFGPFAFDPHNRLLSKSGTEIALPPRVLGLLELLLERPGEVVSRQQLLDRVWKDAFVTDTSLAEAISFLRQALGDDPQAPRYIQTVHRRGYRFVAPLAPSAPPPSAARKSDVKPSIARDLAPWSIAVLSIALATAALWYLAHQPAPELPPVVRLEIHPAKGSRFDRRGPAFAVSPDGRTVAWSACDDVSGACALCARPLDRVEAARLGGTDGAQAPFFSPDGRWLGFFADGKLKKIALAGGSPITIIDAPAPGGAAWSPDGRIVFAGAPAGGLAVVSDQGGEATPLTAPNAAQGELRHIWPSWLPGARGIVFTVTTSPLSAAPGRLAVLSTPSGGWRTLVEGVGRGSAAVPGYILFTRGSDLQAATFDARTLAPTGPADTIVERLATAEGLGQFAVGANGTLAAQTTTAPAPRLSWSDQPDRQLIDAARLSGIALASNGRLAAGVLADGGRSDIWVADLDRGGLSRVTYSGTNVSPVWSADGRRLFFAARTDGPFAIVSRALDDAGAPQKLAGADTHLLPSSAGPDGQLAIVRAMKDGHLAIGLLPRGGVPQMFRDGPFDEAAPALSPDGGWLAFQSDESGRWEVGLRRLSDGRRFALSTGGGTQPVWSADGRTLYFHDGNRLLSAGLPPGPTAVPARAGVVFDRPDTRVIAVAGNGRILVEAQRPVPETAIVTLQWVRELRQRLPLPVTSPR